MASNDGVVGDRPIAEVLLLAAASTRSVARMARFSVRSGSLAFARSD
jgi:hypothetical protein